MDAFKERLGSFLPVENGEIELRIGRILPKRFDSNVHPDHWNTVLKRLQSNSKWSSVEQSTFTDRLFEDGFRERTFLDGAVDRVQKRKQWKADIPYAGRWADVRACFSLETPVSRVPAGVPQTNRVTKKRHRFVHKQLWAFDLTHAQYDRPTDRDQESLDAYTIELELIDRSKPAAYLADYGKLLVEDVLSMLKV